MPYELESLGDQLNRLERQLRMIKIAAVVLAVLAIAFALARSSDRSIPGKTGASGFGPTTPTAFERGGAYIRFLDSRTNVVSRMYRDDQNRAWLSFLDRSSRAAYRRPTAV